MTEYMYRYEGYKDRKIPLYVNDIRCSSDNGVFLMCYTVTSKTQHGVWIAAGYGKPKFILLGCRKQYAYETKERAWASYVIRKRKQRRILQDQLANVTRTVYFVNRKKIPAIKEIVF